MSEGLTGDAALPLGVAPRHRLARLAALARQAGAEPLAEEAQGLAERLRAGRFHVAVLGQFKRGKSTLINALLGDVVLPTGVVPVTSIVTIVSHGPRREARVRGRDGTWSDIPVSDLEAFISEAGNPGNSRGIACAEVFVPSPLLESGMCLVDTPGLGSVFAAGAEATRAFVPHVDAALVVLGTDPPIAEAELDLVQEVSRRVGRLVVVLNKADRVPAADLRQARTFTEQILARAVAHPVGTPLEVSARERLDGGAPTRDWSALTDHLVRLARDSGAALLRDAEARGLRRLAACVLGLLEEERGALTRPVEESKRRIDLLVACAAEAERAMGDLGHLLGAEQARLAETFAARKTAFLERTWAACRDDLIAGLPALAGRGPALRTRATRLAQDVARRWLERWRTEEEPLAEAAYRRTAERFVGHAGEFLRRLARSGGGALAALPEEVGSEVDFRVRSRLVYADLWQAADGSPVRGILDLCRSRASLLRALERETGAYLHHLLYTNGTRIENDLNDRVRESRRLLESEIRDHLREIHASAERALERARARLSEGSGAVRAELGRIEALREQVTSLLESAARPGGP